MSLLEFPPLGDGDHHYALHEMNGRITYGSLQDFENTSKSDLLHEYPRIDKRQLQMLQHSMSRENVRRVFTESQSNRFQQAVDIWQRNGSRGLFEFVCNLSEGSRFGWPIASAGRLLKRAEEDFKGVLTTSEDCIHQLIENASSNLNWKTNWIRCIAFNNEGNRLAVCQLSDHVRIYSFGNTSRSPITLKHPRQKSVTHMTWKPFDTMLLAVACADAILIWRLNPKTFTNRPSTQHAQVIDIAQSFQPVTQCMWDHSLSSALFIASPSSSRLIIMDTLTCESETIGKWTDSRIHRIYSSPDSSKLLVTYYSDFIKVYDRNTNWSEERWSGLHGGCISAVWSNDSTYLLFASRDQPCIYSVRFATRIELNQDGNQILRSYGAETPIEVYNLCEVSYANDDETRHIGGSIHNMQLSPDGKRLAVSFKKNCSVIALFICDWLPSVILTPCALIEGGRFNNASIINFCPSFMNGSLLCVVWSEGRLQYIPMIYGHSARNVYFGDSANSRRRQLEDSLLVRDKGSKLDQFGCEEASLSLSDRQRQRVDEECDDVDRGEGDLSAGSDENNPNHSQQQEFQLFSTSGLYDQLLSNSISDS